MDLFILKVCLWPPLPVMGTGIGNRACFEARVLKNCKGFSSEVLIKYTPLLYQLKNG
jgi:hypothetical protein